jgi:hypothetical protein
VGCEQRGARIGVQPAAGLAQGTMKRVWTNMTLLRIRTRVVAQPRLSERLLTTFTGTSWNVFWRKKFTRIPRIGWPASRRQAVTTANVCFPRFCRFAIAESSMGSLAYDVLCAVSAGFSVAVPGM